MTSKTALPDFWPSMARAAACRCPRCGEAPLFRAYLKPVESCASCGADWGHIRADDGPAWLTILIVGHVVIGLILAVEPYVDIPQWISMTMWSGLALGMTLILLPSAKGVFINIIWRSQAPGSERDI